MKKLRKKVYITAGFNTVSMGTGRSEFNPKKERPGLEYYVETAGKGTLAQINDANNIVGNAEKSSGRSMNNVTVNINRARPNDVANPMSKTHAGIGKIIMTMIAISAKASRIVGLKSVLKLIVGMI